MVITKSELIHALQDEVRILQHLITKVEPSMLDYRPTPKQRSTMELLKYLSLMGPVLIQSALAGTFNEAEWGKRSGALEGKDLAGVVAAVAGLTAEYDSLLAGLTDDAFRKDIELFGGRTKVGTFLVRSVLGAHAAYRTQLFCYLKACGRTELGTLNLWDGVDAPPATA